MTPTKHETEIELDQRVPLIRIVREFDAPPEKVFRAHVQPDLVVQWLGPKRMAMTVDQWDARTGGSYRYLHTSEGEEYAFFGSFHELRAPERIVMTFTFEGFRDGVSLETLHLGSLEDGRRTRLVATSLLDSFEARDAMVSSGMQTGVREGYEKLDALLAG